MTKKEIAGIESTKREETKIALMDASYSCTLVELRDKINAMIDAGFTSFDLDLDWGYYDDVSEINIIGYGYKGEE